MFRCLEKWCTKKRMTPTNADREATYNNLTSVPKDKEEMVGPKAI
jgi:hypothetical protein